MKGLVPLYPCLHCVASLWTFGRFNSCIKAPAVFVTCSSLKSNAEPLSMCLFAIHISWWTSSLNFCPFLIGVFVFSLLLYRVLLLSYMQFYNKQKLWKYFFQPVTTDSLWHFIHLTVSFGGGGVFLIFMKCKLSVCPFMGPSFSGSCLWSLHLSQGYKIFLLCSSRSFTLSGFIVGFIIHLAYCWDMVKVCFLIYGYLIFPVSLIDKNVFSPLNCP